MYKGERVWLSPVLRPVERLTYRIIGVDEEQEQGWIAYLVSILAVTFVSIVFTYLILRFQDHLPLNPQNLPGVPAPLAFNTAISFATNTNWQNYTGETTMSYFSQMVALVLHNFLSAAMGMAIAIVDHSFDRSSNHDHARELLGRHRTRHAVRAAADQRSSLPSSSWPTAPSRTSAATRSCTRSPTACRRSRRARSRRRRRSRTSEQTAVDSSTRTAAHPFENPNGFTNALEIFTVLLIPFGLAITFGKWVGNVKQGIALGAVMGIILIGAFGVAAWQEQQGNPALVGTGATQVGIGAVRRRQHGRQGGSLRADPDGTVRHRHHGYEHRLGRLLTRQLDARSAG